MVRAPAFLPKPSKAFFPQNYCTQPRRTGLVKSILVHLGWLSFSYAGRKQTEHLQTLFLLRLMSFEYIIQCHFPIYSALSSSSPWPIMASHQSPSGFHFSTFGSRLQMYASITSYCSYLVSYTLRKLGQSSGLR
jgi:hypothetical protein